jgi:hypothetical protein
MMEIADRVRRDVGDLHQPYRASWKAPRQIPLATPACLRILTDSIIRC